MLLHAEDTQALQALVPELAQAFVARGWRLAIAESCTGGLMAALCTSVAGSSDWFERGVVSYSNAAKTELLGVPAILIDRHGAVSEAVARAMATGLLQRSSAQVALAVTGVAGPGGGSPDKPVGTVWVAWAWRVQAQGEPVAVGAQCLHLIGDRTAVRGATAQWGLRCGLGLSSSSST